MVHTHFFVSEQSTACNMQFQNRRCKFQSLSGCKYWLSICMTVTVVGNLYCSTFHSNFDIKIIIDVFKKKQQDFKRFTLMFFNFFSCISTHLLIMDRRDRSHMWCIVCMSGNALYNIHTKERRDYLRKAHIERLCL